MAAVGFSVYTAGGTFSGTGNQGSNREDLIDLIVNIDPWDTPLFTKAPKTVAKNTLHEWLTDALQATATTFYADEGADFGAGNSTMTARTRVNNWTMIFRRDIIVSQTQRAVDPAGVQDEYGHQVMKGLKEVARVIESTFFADATTATASSAPRVMKTLETFITTNDYQANSPAIGGAGTATATIISEAVFNGMLDAIFTQGGNPDTVYVNSKGKRQISGFTTNTSVSRNIALNDKRLTNAVDVYESDFGLIQIVLDRWVPQGGTATNSTESAGRAFFIESALVRVAFLRPIKHVPLPPAGDAARGMVLGELTLEVGNEKALGVMTHIKGTAS